MIAIAMAALNLFHPGMLFGQQSKPSKILEGSDTWTTIDLKGDRLSEIFDVCVPRDHLDFKA